MVQLLFRVRHVFKLTRSHWSFRTLQHYKVEIYLLIEGKCTIQPLGIQDLSANFLGHEIMMLTYIILFFVIVIGIEL